MTLEHEDIGAANMHVAGYVQSSDPGAIGAGKVWVDTSLGTGQWRTMVRNAADTGWEFIGGDNIFLQGGTLSDHSISIADTDEWHTTTITIADVSDGDSVEISINGSCFAEYTTGFNNYFYYKLRMSLDNGSTWTYSDVWGNFNFKRAPLSIAGFVSGTVTTAAKIQFGYREASTTNLTYKQNRYNIVTKIG